MGKVYLGKFKTAKVGLGILELCNCETRSLNKVKHSLTTIYFSHTKLENICMTKKYYRTKTDILAQFLQAANAHNGISITHLMYNTFVPHTQVKENLGLLVQKELLDYDLITRTYKTTEKGMEALGLYKKLQQLTNAPTEFKLV